MKHVVSSDDIKATNNERRGGIKIVTENQNKRCSKEVKTEDTAHKKKYPLAQLLSTARDQDCPGVSHGAKRMWSQIVCAGDMKRFMHDETTAYSSSTIHARSRSVSCMVRL